LASKTKEVTVKGHLEKRFQPGICCDASPPACLEQAGEREKVEPAFLTAQATAKRLGVPYYQVQRAVRSGILPVYTLFSGRQLLKFDEVVAIIERTRKEGGR
jgi:hypothetical protein